MCQRENCSFGGYFRGVLLFCLFISVYLWRIVFVFEFISWFRSYMYNVHVIRCVNEFPHTRCDKSTRKQWQLFVIVERISIPFDPFLLWFLLCGVGVTIYMCDVCVGGCEHGSDCVFVCLLFWFCGLSTHVYLMCIYVCLVSYFRFSYYNVSQWEKVYPNAIALYNWIFPHLMLTVTIGIKAYLLRLSSQRSSQTHMLQTITTEID